MQEQDSMYSQFESHEAPSYETSSKPFEQKEKPVREENWQAAGKDGSQTPKGNQESFDAAPTTSASHEFWLWFTGQQTRNTVSMKINAMFDRKTITNYDEEKARYLDAYATEAVK
tara:strand:- start:186 stop:530 length:345 start_codon:yes stop_codon:yes gene_type:complete